MIGSKSLNEIVKSTFRTGWAQMILFCAGVTAVAAVLYCCFGWEVFFVIAISAGATLYHLLLRLIVGRIADCCVPKTADGSCFWFRQRAWESALYRLLRVKRWKKKMPTYFPDDFDLRKTSPEQILRNMCVSEIGHELNMVLGFGSLFLSFFTQEPLTYLWIFAATSGAAAMIDGIFVILQRYNRPRIRRLLKKRNQI